MGTIDRRAVRDRPHEEGASGFAPSTLIDRLGVLTKWLRALYGCVAYG